MASLSFQERHLVSIGTAMTICLDMKKFSLLN